MDNLAIDSAGQPIGEIMGDDVVAKPPQFGTSTLLLFTAVIAIACGGLLGVRALLPEATRPPVGSFAIQLLIVTPVFLPFAFIAFALGRRRLSVAMVIILAVAEAVSLAIAYVVAVFVVRIH